MIERRFGMSKRKPARTRKARSVSKVRSKAGGQIAKVQQALPHDMRASWVSAEERVIPPPEQGELGRYRA
jgi:hypothetical protein